MGTTTPCDNAGGTNPCYFDTHADIYVNTNQGASLDGQSLVLPALMSSATNGLGDQAAWNLSQRPKELRPSNSK